MGVWVKGGGQGGCERRIEVIVKMREKNRVGREWIWVGGGVQGGCERRIEVIVKMRKKSGRGEWGTYFLLYNLLISENVGVGAGRRKVRMYVNEELKLL